VCGTEFESQTVGSCGFASKRTDFRPNYWGANPVSHFYHDCPTCGFCAPEKMFDSEIVSKEFIKQIKEMGPLKKTSWEENLTRKIERAMRCLELMKEYKIIEINKFTLANNWINAYWWANDRESELRFANIVLGYFKEAYKQEQVPEGQILEILYLRGEINRRIGNIEKANELFDHVLELAQDLPDQSKIASLAYQQKTDPQEIL
jgi:uncharacterized protein (DUF2225 family)